MRAPLPGAARDIAVRAQEILLAMALRDVRYFTN
jgi:hypothetical protein